MWLQYAAFEEIDTKDYDRVRDVYKAAIKLVPHKSFTFAKVSYVCARQLKETNNIFSFGWPTHTSKFVDLTSLRHVKFSVLVSVCALNRSSSQAISS